MLTWPELSRLLLAVVMHVHALRRPDVSGRVVFSPIGGRESPGAPLSLSRVGWRVKSFRDNKWVRAAAAAVAVARSSSHQSNSRGTRAFLTLRTRGVSLH